MGSKRNSITPVYAAFLSLLAVPAAADCELIGYRNLCHPAAQNAYFWIGEYFGESEKFSMTINGRPFHPPFEEKGTMTLFEMNDALGFAGGGAFNGTAELTRSHNAPLDPTSDDESWSWLFEEETLGQIQEIAKEGAEVTGEDCPLQYWPRWTGTYQPPNSPLMNISLIAVTDFRMMGRVYYSGIQNGSEVTIDSWFRIAKSDFDPSDYEVRTFPDNHPICLDESNNRTR